MCNLKIFSIALILGVAISNVSFADEVETEVKIEELSEVKETTNEIVNEETQSTEVLEEKEVNVDEKEYEQQLETILQTEENIDKETINTDKQQKTDEENLSSEGKTLDNIKEESALFEEETELEEIGLEETEADALFEEYEEQNEKTQETEVCIHKYKIFKIDPICLTDGEVYKQCMLCGNKVTIELIKATGHRYALNRKESVDPTCVVGGYFTYTCKDCGACYKELREPLGHHYVLDVKNSKVPTTSKEGYLIYTCVYEGCGLFYKKLLPPLKEKH